MEKMMKTAAEAFLSETSLFLICGALLVLLLVLAALMVWQRISGHRKISELDDQLEETEKKMRTLEEAYEKEREYRERVGRLLITLAKEAKTVERIVCGIGQKIK